MTRLVSNKKNDICALVDLDVKNNATGVGKMMSFFTKKKEPKSPDYIECLGKKRSYNELQPERS